MEKSVVKKILINVMLLLFVAVNGSAQFITGSITDRQGLPVEFANIVLLSVPDSSFLQGTVSDESGSFRISNRRFYIYTNLCDQSIFRSVIKPSTEIHEPVIWKISFCRMRRSCWMRPLS